MTTTTIVGVLDEILARLADPVYTPVDSAGNALARRWPDDNTALPDTPAPFVYFDQVMEPGRVASFGGGRNATRYRNPGELNCYVFVPRGYGLREALYLAEVVAAVFRGWRSSGGLSCFEATVHSIGEGAELVPPGLASVAGNYACAVASIQFFYDQVG